MWAEQLAHAHAEGRAAELQRIVQARALDRHVEPAVDAPVQELE